MVSVAYNILHAAYVNDATLRGIARVRVGLFLYLMALLFILGDRIEYWSTFLVLTLGFGAWGLLVLFLVRNRTFHGSFLLKAGGAIDQGFLVISLFALAETNLPGQTGIYLMFMLLLMDMVLVVAHFGVSTGFTIAAAANVAYVTAQSIAVGSAVWPVPIVIHVPSALIVAGITGWLVYTYRYEYRERSIELERNRRTVAAFRETAARLTLEEDPEQAMEGLVDVVRDLVNASYGALAIWDSPVTAGRWFTSGFTAEQLKAVGRMPQGRGVLGLIGTKNRPSDSKM